MKSKSNRVYFCKMNEFFSHRHSAGVVVLEKHVRRLAVVIIFTVKQTSCA